MNILIVAKHDWSGAGHALMKAINEHTEHKARAVSVWRNWLRYPYDILTSSEEDLLPWIEWADVLNVHDDADNLLPPTAPHQPIVTTYHGSWYRQWWKAINRRHRAHTQTCLTVDLSLHGPTWIGRAMPDLSQTHDPADGFMVAHAPTGRHKKGTEHVVVALDGLEGVTLDIIEKVPNEVALRRKARAHLFVDQAGDVAIGYGTNSLEAWSIGMPCISNADDRVCAAIEQTVGYLPFCRAGTADEIRSAVMAFRDTPDFYAYWREVGRKYVRENHAPEVVAGRFVEVCAGALAKPTVKVYSHPRSGTNFLAATLKQCFYPTVALGSDGGWAGHWADRFKVEPLPYARLLGDHRNWRPSIGKCVYILRDGRDVILSFWRSKRTCQHPSWRSLTLSEYLRRPLDWLVTPGFKGQPGVTIAEHWRDQLESWRGRPGVHYVRYEDLALDSQQTLAELGDFLGLPAVSGAVADLVGPTPNEGRVGAWREHFTVADLEFFHSKVPPDFWGLWHGRNSHDLGVPRPAQSRG